MGQRRVRSIERSLRAAALAAIVLTAACSRGSAESASTGSTDSPQSRPTTTLGDPIEGAAGLDDPYFPDLGNGGYDVGQYSLDLVWDPESSRLDGMVNIHAEAREHLRSFNLDLTGFELDRIMVDGDDASFERDGNEVRVEPSRPIPPGSDFQASVTYHGTPQQHVTGALPVALGWVGLDEGGAYVFGEPDGASTWFPSNDHPSDKATFTIRVTAPDGLEVVSNGILTETAPSEGAARWVWEMDQPMAPYLATVVISDMELWEGETPDGVPLRSWYPTSLADRGVLAFEENAEMVDFFAETFGAYPFDAYGVVVVPGPVGAALETQTIPLFGNEILGEGGVQISDVEVERVAAHELAHQWFGNSVTPSTWADIWLNEGFATYSEALWFEHSEPSYDVDAALSAMHEELQAYMAENETTPPGDPGVDLMFDTPVYNRGALTLHALRHTVGDEAFFTILHEWVDRFSYDNASTQDLVELSEEISDQELDALFDDWLYQAELPALP